MKSLLTSLPNLLPFVFIWAEKQESLILAEGMPLTEAQMIDARRAGVACPDKVRITRVETLPEPDNDDIMFAAKQIGLFSTRSMSLTLGYGIWLQKDSWDNRHALVHEFVHVGQYEKLKGLRAFLGQYLRECIDPGYPFGRLEQEAIIVSKDICKPLTVKLPS
jgi:hypothetical protein